MIEVTEETVPAFMIALARTMLEFDQATPGHCSAFRETLGLQIEDLCESSRMAAREREALLSLLRGLDLVLESVRGDGRP